jgi:transcription elongation factor Elf1
MKITCTHCGAIQTNTTPLKEKNMPLRVPCKYCKKIIPIIFKRTFIP